MDIKNVEQKASTLLPRKEVRLTIAFEGSTPSRKQLKQAAADKLKVKEDFLIIRHVYTQYGTKTADIIVYVYNDENAMKGIEYEKMINKNSHKKPEEKAA